MECFESLFWYLIVYKFEYVGCVVVVDVNVLSSLSVRKAYSNWKRDNWDLGLRNGLDKLGWGIDAQNNLTHINKY